MRLGASIFALTTLLMVTPGCPETTPIEETTEPEPEALCTEWAGAACARLAECCQEGGKFDAFECTVAMSGSCMDFLKVELIHDGYVVYDEDAAKECLVPLERCDGVIPTTLAREEACSNALTGHRPLGAGCDDSLECARPETGFAACYPGLFYGGYSGVCADVVVSTNGKCGFAKDTYVFTTCPADSYCDVQPPEPGPDDVPSDYEFAFEADCVPYVTEGGICLIVDEYDYKELPCAEGLFCKPDIQHLDQSKCAPRAPIGGVCEGYSSEECVDGADCDYETQTCQSYTGEEGLFCQPPIVCGDGECQYGEDRWSCVEDCGYCGDDYCGPDEDYCLEDCSYCGDGYCYWDEDPETCPQDCQVVCGDGLCQYPEDDVSCPLDCGYCGDGICTSAEESWCADDCDVSCMKCGDFIVNGSDTSQLCTDNGPPTSADLYIALSDCVCDGACAELCQDNVCAGANLTTACQNCVFDTAAGCGNAFSACANDL